MIKAKAAKEFVVFYAWQSDRQTRFNKLLIRAALDFAAKRISDDPAVDVRVRIDADTEGVLGHVPVTETILKKVMVCDAFVPDLTFVATTPDDKLIPNPNVMLEYGYALRAKTYSIMIPVMNTAYGPPEKLPFDMAHSRHPLQFELPTTARDSERRSARNSLAQEFESILRLMIAKTSVADEQEAAERSQQKMARRFLAPELKRTIERVLYIHSTGKLLEQSENQSHLENWLLPQTSWTKRHYLFAYMAARDESNTAATTEIDTAYRSSPFCSTDEDRQAWTAFGEYIGITVGEGGSLTALKEMSQAYSQNSDVLHYLASGLDWYKEYTEAAVTYEKAAATAKTDDQFIRNMRDAALAYNRGNQKEKAQEIIEQAKTRISNTELEASLLRTLPFV